MACETQFVQKWGGTDSGAKKLAKCQATHIGHAIFTHITLPFTLVRTAGRSQSSPLQLDVIPQT